MRGENYLVVSLKGSAATTSAQTALNKAKELVVLYEETTPRGKEKQVFLYILH